MARDGLESRTRKKSSKAGTSETLPTKKRPKGLTDNEANLRMARLQVFMNLGKGLIQWGGLVAIAYLMAPAAEKAAGNTTIINFLADIDLGKWAGYAIATFCGGGWAIERRMKKKQIERTTDRIKQLECLVDPDRSSSGLDRRGNPPREE
jgi:hypothetical protein